jgi:hypothetical protein
MTLFAVITNSNHFATDSNYPPDWRTFATAPYGAYCSEKPLTGLKNPLITRLMIAAVSFYLRFIFYAFISFAFFLTTNALTHATGPV